MITVSNLGMQFGGQWLFQHVDLQFLNGNCYGIIGANGAGKSTFLRILTGELDSTTGSISVEEGKRVSVLKQNQNAYDEFTVMDTVIMGNQHGFPLVGVDVDGTGGGVQFTGEDAQEGGFAGTVGTDDAVAVAGEELQIHMLEQPLSTKLHAKIANCDHNISFADST